MTSLLSGWSSFEELVYSPTRDGTDKWQRRYFQKNFSFDLPTFRPTHLYVACIQLQYLGWYGEGGLSTEDDIGRDIETTSLSVLISDCLVIHVATADVLSHKHLIFYGLDQEQLQERVLEFCKQHPRFMPHASVSADPAWFWYDDFPNTYSFWGLSIPPKQHR